jgi:predicted dehydrogenase
MVTRRRFIYNTAFTVFGVNLAPVVHADMLKLRQKVSPNERLIIGLIGCNSMGFADARDFLLQPEVELAALCDVDSSVLETRTRDVLELQDRKPDLYKDYRELLDRKDIDAVIIGTPDHWHCLQMVHACEAGKDVYVEKPLANSIRECNIMLRAARRHNRIVQVGQQQRSGAEWKAAMDFIASGQLGKLRRVNIWANFNYGAGAEKMPDEPAPAGVDYDMWLGPAPSRPFNKSRFHGWWRMFWDYGGGLMTDWGVHLVDMPLWSFDVQTFPKSVVATGGIYASRDRAIETADTLNVIYEMNDYLISWEHNGGIEIGPYNQPYGVAWIGTNGTLVADREHWTVFPGINGTGGYRMEVPEEYKSDGQSHINHVRNFIDCVKTHKKPAADITIGHRACIYTHLGNIAYRTGRKIIYDSTTETVLNDVEATLMLTPAYSEPYKLPDYRISCQ